MTYKFTRSKPDEVLKSLGKEKAIEAIEKMTLIRNFEIRAESAYQQGKIGGFFHAYMGQEAIQTGAVMAMGVDENWWLTTYRCHALALLMGVTPDEAMAEFYGKETGIAKGRGGSMHLCHDRMLGGYGIVGGHLPAAAGAAFSLKYQKKDGVAVGFLGDGASVQGAFHETMNLASLWDLPLIIVIENNLWGMGTAVDRAVCVEPIAENFAKAYGIESVTLDGMNFFDTYH
ncbi:MAG: thiamine pyrophosphate-dependent enzyme, partial [Simkaniaceae bacterium]|nr:thiamine pyrophosphate-dependent enzyme [Simkaniaceae bacterium]